MEKEDLVKKLEDMKPPEVELPGHKSQLKMALLRGKYPAQDKSRGITSLLKDAFIPGRKVWLTALASTLAIALIATLAVALPPLFGKDNAVLAKEIALNAPQVQATLGGEEPVEVTVLEVVDDKGKMRVFIEVKPDMFILADVDMGNQEVVSMKVQEISDITKQEVIDIARRDPRVQELLDKGAQIYDLEMVQVFPAMMKVWRDSYSQQLGVSPDDLIGFIGSLSLQLGDTDSQLYYIIVNVTTDKVVMVNEPGKFMGTVVTVTTITSISP